jgi:hypothetical protein
MEPSSFKVSRFLEETLVFPGVDVRRLVQLKEVVQRCEANHASDILSKEVLSHTFGERLAIMYREWVRSQMPMEEELPCGGASIENYYAYIREQAELATEDAA